MHRDVVKKNIDTVQIFQEGHKNFEKNISIDLKITKFQINWEISSNAFGLLRKPELYEKTEFTPKQIVFLCFT